MTMPDDLRQALDALPDPPPPEALWERLRTRRRSQVRRRRAATGLASGALVVALAVALLPPSAPPSSAPVAQGPVPAAKAPEAVDDRLRALDRALQAGYDRGATDAELAPMWEARHALLAHGDTPRGHPAHINDI